MAKKVSKTPKKPYEKSLRTERRSQLIREPAALLALAPVDRQAIDEYYRCHPLAKRGR